MYRYGALYSAWKGFNAVVEWFATECSISNPWPDSDDEHEEIKIMTKSGEELVLDSHRSPDWESLSDLQAEVIARLID